MTRGGGSGGRRGGEHLDALVMVVRLPFDRRLSDGFCRGMRLVCSDGMVSLPNALDAQTGSGHARYHQQQREAALAAVRLVPGGEGIGDGSHPHPHPSPHVCEAAFVLRRDQGAESHPLTVFNSKCAVTSPRGGIAWTVWNASTASAILREAEVVRILRSDRHTNMVGGFHTETSDAHRPLQLPLATEATVDTLSVAIESYAREAAAESFLEVSSSVTTTANSIASNMPEACVKAARSDACSQAKAAIVATVSDLWSKVSGLSDSNVTSPSAPVSVKSRPCICVDPALENCLAYPISRIGRLSALTFEAADSKNVAIISDDHRIFATPRGSADGRLIVIFGQDYEDSSMQRSVWIDGSLIVGGDASATADAMPTPQTPMLFKPGERISLRGFSMNGNHGVFGIVAVKSGERYATATGIRLILEEVPPADASPGIIALTRFETNRDGATASGCFGHRAGPATALRTITVYGIQNPGRIRDEVDDALSERPLRTVQIRFHESFAANKFEVNELIRLQHFQTPGNNGVFRVTSRPGRNMLEVPTGAKCCSAKLCPLDCRNDEGHGVCNVDTGICECEASWTGASCTEPAMPCPDACSGHGTCNKQKGECACAGEWRGIDCAIPYIPCNCSALDNSTVHGTCDTTVGVMHCDPGPYAGKCCTPLPCFRNCSGEAHGLCDKETGLCKCKRAWEDADCGTPKCGKHGFMLPKKTEEDGAGGSGMSFMPGSDDDDPDSSGVYPPDDFGIETKNKEDWCDMSDPFENPFCPTPNPMFNVLIKMVIPVINRLLGKLMDGQKYERDMYKKLIPPEDGGGYRGGPIDAFLEESTTMYSREESQERTFKPKNEHEGKVIPGLKKGMYASLVNPMTQSLLTSLTKELHEPLQEALHGSLLLSLRDFLNLTLTHSLEHTLGNTVALGLSQSVPLLLERVLPATLHPTIMHEALHYGNYYAAYFSDFYADYYASQLFPEKSKT
eukprot:g100.t1